MGNTNTGWMGNTNAGSCGSPGTSGMPMFVPVDIVQVIWRMRLTHLNALTVFLLKYISDH